MSVPFGHEFSYWTPKRIKKQIELDAAKPPIGTRIGVWVVLDHHVYRQVLLGCRHCDFEIQVNNTSGLEHQVCVRSGHSMGTLHVADIRGLLRQRRWGRGSVMIWSQDREELHLVHHPEMKALTEVVRLKHDWHPDTWGDQ